MRTRLFGIVATLWFFVAVLSLFVALVFSPLGLRLLLPGAQPSTWIYPTLLTVPPIFLLSEHWLGAKPSPVALGFLALALSALVLGLLAVVGQLIW